MNDSNNTPTISTKISFSARLTPTADTNEAKLLKLDWDEESTPVKLKESAMSEQPTTPGKTPIEPDWVSKIVLEVSKNVTGEINNLETKICLRFDELTEQNGALKKSVEFAHEKITQVEQENSTLKSELGEAKGKIWALQRDKAVMCKQFDHLKIDQLRIETQIRKVNLTLSGVPESESKQEGGCLALVRAVLQKYMGLKEADVEINNCYRLGQPGKGKNGKQAYPRNIMICLNTIRDRKVIWSNKRKLKDSKIYLGEDLPRETERRRSQMVPTLKAARALPKYNGKVFLNGDRLTVDKRVYTTDTLHELPEDINPIMTATQRTDTTTLFFTRHSPFSNHYTKDPFTLGNTTYSTTEQFYFANKADKMKDVDQYLAVMAETDPALVLKEGKKIQNHSGVEWADMAVEVMKIGNMAKYSQNVGVRTQLLATAPTMLAESSKADDYWGTGYDLTHPDRNNQDLWGSNFLGQILVQIRHDLTPTQQHHQHPSNPITQPKLMDTETTSTSKELTSHN
jgi:hypothetical protein